MAAHFDLTGLPIERFYHLCKNDLSARELMDGLGISISNERRRRGFRTAATFRRISGRNQLVGRGTDIKVKGPDIPDDLSIGDQRITSIVTADAVQECV